ncbi:hypothetical protein GCM10010405_36440 [Streptomyces macrosporus]|uniref:Uncharacterized protein n=1 Tax=Streptomyces macrosporus TaxID=44032 RepID=A0ABP5XCV7_9ACTN
MVTEFPRRKIEFDGRRFGAALAAFGELKWIRAPVAFNAVFERWQAPILGWRYENPESKLKKFFRGIVEDCPESVDWCFEASFRNWFIVPCRLIEVMDREGGNFVDSAVSVAQEDQDFCIQANTDMELILQGLEKAAREKGE